MSRKRTTRGRMGRIQQLPKEIKSVLDKLLRSGVSQRDILGHLNPLLAKQNIPPLSSAGLNRYASRMERAGERIREAREVAAVWTAKFGEAPTGEVGQHIVEMLRTMAFEATLRAKDESEDPKAAMDASAISAMALAVQRLERAAEISAERERKLQAAYAQQAADKAEDVCKQKGVTPEVINAIREVLTESVASG